MAQKTRQEKLQPPGESQGRFEKRKKRFKTAGEQNIIPLNPRRMTK